MKTKISQNSFLICLLVFGLLLSYIAPNFITIAKADDDITETNNPITITADDAVVLAGDSSFDLLEGVTAIDMDGNPMTVTIFNDGGFNISKVGIYKIIYQIEDPIDNTKISKERIITVEEQIQESTKEDSVDLLTDVSRASSLVNNVADLSVAVATASQGDIITLSDSFVSGNATISIPNIDVTIDGNNKIWNLGTITINGSGTGSLIVKNLEIDGASVSTRLFVARHTNGQLILENMHLHNALAGAIDISTSATASTIINKTRINDNKATNTASAIWVGSSSNLEINNSTIENNVADGAGYECGALSSKGYSATLTINNTIFRNNQNKCANSGVVGGGGGAIAMHYLYGNLKISESYFEGNKTNGEGVNIQSTFDGGAIYIFDGRNGATIDIDKTTFDSNIAYDDGGAMMIQGTGNPGLTTTVTNSTFYNNKAYGLDGGNVSGGAIQFFKNGGSSVMKNQVSGCTFVGNEAGNELSTMNQQGGAIGLSGAGFLAIPSVSTSSSLFIGNKVYGSNGKINIASNYKDISNSTTTQLTTNIINADKGATPAYTVEDVLGTGNVMLTDNFSGIKAGVENMIVKTIPIEPEGLADNQSNNILNGYDQRTYSRYKDIGAIEASWIKYNANGGKYNLPALPAYDGTKYYELDASNEYLDYYDMGYINKNGTIKNGLTDLQIENGLYEFTGWSTDPTATTPDPTYAADNAVNYTTENLTLYAVWKLAEKFTVTYDTNTGIGNVPIDANEYLLDDIVTVLGQDSITKDGYKFIGWNTSADGSGTVFQADDTFPITSDITLYAQWAQVFKVTYDVNTGIGNVPIDTSEYLLDDIATVLGQNSITKDGYTFIGWNTSADGSGTVLQADDTFPITSDITLYAQWVQVFKVTYDVNSGSGKVPIDTSEYLLDDTVTVLGQDSITKDGYKFIGWNTLADGSGTALQVDDTFPITENTTLYAQWYAIETNVIKPKDKNHPSIIDAPKKKKETIKTADATSINPSLWLLVSSGMLAIIILIRKK